MLKHKILAVCTTGLLCSSALLPPLTAFAEEETSGTQKTEETTIVEIEKSAAISALPEGQITGRIAVIVREHTVHASITLQSADVYTTYYDMDLEPSDDGSPIEYVFFVHYSECPDEKNLAYFETTYTSDFFDGIYSSCYTVTLTSPDTPDTIYTDEPVLIADPHSDDNTAVTGTTVYIYDTSYDETLTSLAEKNDKQSVLIEGSLEITQQIRLLWNPYTLGDADNDGTYTLNDAFLILMYYASIAVGNEPPEGVLEQAADVDKDGTVTLNDAYLTLLYVARRAVGDQMTFDEFLENQ